MAEEYQLSFTLPQLRALIRALEECGVDSGSPQTELAHFRSAQLVTAAKSAYESLKAPPQTSNGARSPESQVRLQQALRTLRAIREGYESGRDVGSDYVRAYSVQVAFGYADMFWITAAIEAFEKAIVGDTTEAAVPAANARPET